MNSFLSILLKFLPFVPQIAATVESTHSGASVETKTQIAASYLNLATNVSTALLPKPDADIANAAGQIAQGVLAATVQAIHNANNPPAPTPVAG
jgi:hypothetical protein